MCDDTSAPSDVDEVEIDEIEPVVPMTPEGNSAKLELMNTVGGMDSTVTESKRLLVNELLLALEAGNPTEAPAESSLLNGEWELRYNGGYGTGNVDWSPTRQLALFMYAGGYSPAAFGMQLANVLPDEFFEVGTPTIQISRYQPRVEARSQVKIANFASDVTITSNLQTETGVRLRETNSAVSVTTGSDLPNSFDLPQELQYSRNLYVTYLDDELLVVRDETGVPEILFRKEMEFRTNEGEPSSADDDTAPGAG
jgi:hypothetical protein